MFRAILFGQRFSPSFIAVVGVACGGVGAVAQDGWRKWDAGGVSFEAPATMRAPALDQQTPRIADPRKPDWTFTVTDSPNRPDRGATMTFTWSPDVADHATGSQTLADNRGKVANHDVRRIDWRDRSMGWSGRDIVIYKVGPSGEAFKFTCHAPEARWAEIQRVCERVASTIRLPSELATSPQQTTAQPAPAPDGQAALSNYNLAREKLAAFARSRNIDEWRAALEAAKNAAAAAPLNADYWRTLGYAYAMAPKEFFDPKPPVSAYEKALALNRSDATTRMLLASSLIAEQSYGSAIDQIEAALAIKPDLATAAVLFDLARLYAKDGSAERGTAFFGALAARQPHTRIAQLAQAILLQASGRGADALMLARTIAIDPNAPQADAERARALLNAWL